MGISKTFYVVFVIMAMFIALGYFAYDVQLANSNAQVQDFTGQTNTTAYVEALSISSAELQANIKSGQQQQGIISSVENFVVILTQSVGVAVVGLFSSLNIVVGLFGFLGVYGIIPAAMMSLGISYILLQFFLDSLKAMRLGDTGGS